MTNELRVITDQTQMTPRPTEPSKQPIGAGTPISKALKFSKKRLALAFAIASVSDAIGAFATPLPPIVWVVDLGTALLLFLVLGRQWLLLPGLVLEAIPAWGCFHSGCWWSGRLLSWALLGRILNGTDEPHQPDLAQRDVANKLRFLADEVSECGPATSGPRIAPLSAVSAAHARAFSPVRDCSRKPPSSRLIINLGKVATHPVPGGPPDVAR